MSHHPDRNLWLEMDDESLIKACQIQFYKSTGPGGQKKNKTESAVRLTHEETGVEASAQDDRQQSVNRKRAVRRLRLKLAMEVRMDPVKWEGQLDMNPKNEKFPLFIAHIFDALEDSSWQVSTAGTFLELSTGKLIRILAKDDRVWQQANRRRQQLNLKPLKRN